MRIIYDIYSKKNLGIMHLVKRDGTGDFKNPKEKRIPMMVKFTIPKPTKKSAKMVSPRSFVPSTTTSFMLETKVDMLDT